MTFPVVESTVIDENMAYSGTTFDVTMPSGVVSGDLLIVGVSKPTSVTGVADGSENWTEEFMFGAFPCQIFTKIATGNESSAITVTTASAIDANSAVVYRISGWKGDSLVNDIERNQLWNANTVTKTFNTLTLSGWSGEDTLYMGAIGAENDATVVSTYGANLPDNRIDAGAGSANNRNVTGFATAESTADSFSPDSWTINQADDGYSVTLAIRPAAGGTTYESDIALTSGTDVGLAATSTFPRALSVTSGSSASLAATTAFARAFGVTSGTTVTSAAVPAFVRAMGVDTGTGVGIASVPAFGRAMGVTSGASVGLSGQSVFEAALALSSGTSVGTATQAAFQAAFTATVGDLVTIFATAAGGTFESAMAVSVGASVAQKTGFTYASAFSVDSATTAGMSATQFHEAAMAVAVDVATTMIAGGSISAGMAIDVAVQVENSTGCALCGHMTVTVGSAAGKGAALNTSGLTIGSDIGVRMRAAYLWREDGELEGIWIEDDPV